MKLIWLLLALLTATSAVPFTCPDDDDAWIPFNDQCYYYHSNNDHTSWINAAYSCPDKTSLLTVANGTELLSVINEAIFYGITDNLLFLGVYEQRQIDGTPFDLSDTMEKCSSSELSGDCVIVDVNEYCWKTVHCDTQIYDTTFTMCKAQSDVPDCPKIPGESWVPGVGGSCYRFINDKGTWNSEFCSALNTTTRNASLAVIETVQEAIWLQQRLISELGLQPLNGVEIGAYIGLTSLGTGTWNWIDGHAFQEGLLPWQINPTNEQCAAVLPSTTTWNRLALLPSRCDIGQQYSVLELNPEYQHLPDPRIWRAVSRDCPTCPLPPPLPTVTETSTTIIVTSTLDTTSVQTTSTSDLNTQSGITSAKKTSPADETTLANSIKTTTFFSTSTASSNSPSTRSASTEANPTLLTQTTASVVVETLSTATTDIPNRNQSESSTTQASVSSSGERSSRTSVDTTIKTSKQQTNTRSTIPNMTTENSFVNSTAETLSSKTLPTTTLSHSSQPWTHTSDVRSSPVSNPSSPTTPLATTTTRTSATTKTILIPTTSGLSSQSSSSHVASSVAARTSASTSLKSGTKITTESSTSAQELSISSTNIVTSTTSNLQTTVSHLSQGSVTSSRNKATTTTPLATTLIDSSSLPAKTNSIPVHFSTKKYIETTTEAETTAFNPSSRSTSSINSTTTKKYTSGERSFTETPSIQPEATTTVPPAEGSSSVPTVTSSDKSSTTSNAVLTTTNGHAAASSSSYMHTNSLEQSTIATNSPSVTPFYSSTSKAERTTPTTASTVKSSITQSPTESSTSIHSMSPIPPTSQPNRQKLILIVCLVVGTCTLLVIGGALLLWRKRWLSCRNRPYNLDDHRRPSCASSKSLVSKKSVDTTSTWMEDENLSHPSVHLQTDARSVQDRLSLPRVSISSDSFLKRHSITSNQLLALPVRQSLQLQLSDLIDPNV